MIRTFPSTDKIGFDFNSSCAHIDTNNFDKSLMDLFIDHDMQIFVQENRP